MVGGFGVAETGEPAGDVVTRGTVFIPCVGGSEVEPGRVFELML